MANGDSKTKGNEAVLTALGALSGLGRGLAGQDVTPAFLETIREGGGKKQRSLDLFNARQAGLSGRQATPEILGDGDLSKSYETGREQRQQSLENARDRMAGANDELSDLSLSAATPEQYQAGAMAIRAAVAASIGGLHEADRQAPILMGDLDRMVANWNRQTEERFEGDAALNALSSGDVREVSALLADDPDFFTKSIRRKQALDSARVNANSFELLRGQDRSNIPEDLVPLWERVNSYEAGQPSVEDMAFLMPYRGASGSLGGRIATQKESNAKEANANNLSQGVLGGLSSLPEGEELLRNVAAALDGATTPEAVAAAVQNQGDNALEYAGGDLNKLSSVINALGEFAPVKAVRVLSQMIDAQIDPDQRSDYRGEMAFENPRFEADMRELDVLTTIDLAFTEQKFFGTGPTRVVREGDPVVRQSIEYLYANPSRRPDYNAEVAPILHRLLVPAFRIGEFNPARTIHKIDAESERIRGLLGKSVDADQKIVLEGRLRDLDADRREAQEAASTGVSEQLETLLERAAIAAGSSSGEAWEFLASEGTTAEQTGGVRRASPTSESLANMDYITRLGKAIDLIADNLDVHLPGLSSKDRATVAGDVRAMKKYILRVAHGLNGTFNEEKVKNLIDFSRSGLPEEFIEFGDQSDLDTREKYILGMLRHNFGTKDFSITEEEFLRIYGIPNTGQKARLLR